MTIVIAYNFTGVKLHFTEVYNEIANIATQTQYSIPKMQINHPGKLGPSTTTTNE